MSANSKMQVRAVYRSISERTGADSARSWIAEEIGIHKCHVSTMLHRGYRHGPAWRRLVRILTEWELQVLGVSVLVVTSRCRKRDPGRQEFRLIRALRQSVELEVRRV